MIEFKVHAGGNLSDAFKKRMQRAQFALDSQIMTDMTPIMPMVTGTFINNTRAISASWAGTGKVCAAAPPYGRFLYYGKVMVDPVTGSPWARAGVKKVLTDRDLKFQRPSAVPMWFETAKQQHIQSWLRTVKKELG